MDSIVIKLCFVQQLRDLSQLTQRRQLGALSADNEFQGLGLLQKNPPQERNLSYIRTMEKEKRETFEVCVTINYV